MNETIKKNEEFQNIFRKGHSIQGRYLVVYFLRNHFDHNRFGFCSGSKLGTAVRRNRFKRLLREAARSVAPFTLTGWDLILVARGGIKSADLSSIIHEYKQILVRADLLKKD
jgi:ribonuclease P protein component